jgi:hypothetical protein
MTFSRHFDDNIHEWIETQEQGTLFNSIRRMNVSELDDFRDELNTECSLNPSFKRTQTFRISCKAAILRYSELKKAGARRIIQVGPPLTVANMLVAGIQGIIIGDIVADMISNWRERQ